MNVLRSSAKRNPQRPVKKRSGNNTAGELKVLENSLDFFSPGPQGPLRRPAKPQLSFRKLRLSPLQGSFTSSMWLSRRLGRSWELPFSVPMAMEISNPARGCGLDRANPDRGAQRRGLDATRSSPNPRAWIAPATCTLLTDLNVARIIWCTPRNEENRFERFSQLLLLSIFVDSKDLLPDVAVMSLSGTPCFKSRCTSLSPNGLYRRRWTLPSTARRLQSFASLQSKLAISALPYSIHRSRSLLGCSCLFLCMIFLWNGFFLSASASRSVLLLLLLLLLLLFSVVHACAAEPNLPGRQKSDTARCHWQREVNVIRRPLPRTTGRTSECLHASSWSKCMRDVTEHVGTRLDRFIPVSTALLKKKKSSSTPLCMHACTQAPASIVVSNRSVLALRFFLALSCLLSSYCSLLTVALCYLQSWRFSQQRAKIFKKVCLFLAGVGGGPVVLSMASAFSEHSLWSIHKRCSLCLDWTKALLSLTLLETNETEKKIELERREWVSAGWVTHGGRRGREREIEREPRQTDRRRG